MIWFQFFLRSLRAQRRSFMSTLMLFGFPIIFFIVFGLLFTSGNERQLARIAVTINIAQNPLIVKLQEIEGVEVDILSNESAETDFNNGKYTAYIKDIEGKLVAKVDKQQQKIFAILMRTIQVDNFSEKNGTIGNVMFEPVKVESAFAKYAISGLFGLALIQLLIYATAMPILTERGKGAWRLFSMLPAPLVSVFVGEALSRTVLAITQVIILTILMAVFLDFKFENNWLYAVPIFIISIVMAIAIGFAVGGIISDERWGIHVLTFLNLYMLFFGNIFSPVSTIESIRIFALINPITYATDSIRWVITGIPGTFPISIMISIMILWTGLALISSYYFFKFETVTTE